MRMQKSLPTRRHVVRTEVPKIFGAPLASCLEISYMAGVFRSPHYRHRQRQQQTLFQR